MFSNAADCDIFKVKAKTTWKCCALKTSVHSFATGHWGFDFANTVKNQIASSKQGSFSRYMIPIFCIQPRCPTRLISQDERDRKAPEWRHQVIRWCLYHYCLRISKPQPGRSHLTGLALLILLMTCFRHHLNTFRWLLTPNHKHEIYPN